MKDRNRLLRAIHTSAPAPAPRTTASGRVYRVQRESRQAFVRVLGSPSGLWLTIQSDALLDRLHHRVRAGETPSVRIVNFVVVEGS